MKTIIAALLNDPIVVLISSITGSALILYLQDMAFQALLWYVPCGAIILADLSAGIKAARFRGEKVRVSSAIRRTVNKGICYASWIIFCVACNKQYATEFCAWAGMGLVFFIEGISFFSNLLEPHGIKISVKALLGFLGKKTNMEGIEDIVKHEKE